MLISSGAEEAGPLAEQGLRPNELFSLPLTWALDIKRNTTAFAPLPYSVWSATQATRRPDENIPFLLRNPSSVPKCQD